MLFEIHAYVQCLNNCFVMDTYSCCALNCIHTSCFEMMSLKRRNVIWRVWKEKIWSDIQIYVSMAYECHWNVLRCISIFSKRMSCHPPLREVIIGFNIEPYYGDCCWEISRGNWGPCKPHLTTMLRARHVHKNGVPRYMDIYFQE